MNAKLDSFKTFLVNGMLDNFTWDGFLTPMLFFFQDDTPMMAMIPNRMLSTPEGKIELATYIKAKCAEPNVLAAGMIIEAHGAKIDADSEEIKSVFNGKTKVSELKQALDIIILIFSTPEKEEMFSYVVDCKNKLIIGEFGNSDEFNAGNGLFNDFFKWNKN